MREPRAAAVLVVLLGVCVGPATAEMLGPSPRFDGDSIPVPPAQSKPWTPPETQLRDVDVSAITVLFEQGLADPRGCRYREIEVGTGSSWSGDAGVVKTHGWVLPPRDGTTQPFAVCWNGLVYPVVYVGDDADLRPDILAVVKADDETRAVRARERPDHPFYRYRHAVAEGESISHESMLSLKACFLLRLGEVDLAENLWKSWTAGMRPRTNDDDVHLKDPYLMLATEWTWALFDRAVCAHMRGDDRMALLSARALVPIWDAVEAAAEKRGFERPSHIRGYGDKVPYLYFLEPIRVLLVDQERRAKEPAVERALTLGLEGFPDRTERIKALIRDLEEVNARQWGQPGGVSLGEDAIVQALIGTGDAAVEPLLECLEKDTRLTRSVHFHRDFHRHRSLIGVHEAAYVALSGILKASFFGVASTGDDLTSRGTEGRKVVAERVRAYWNRFKGVPEVERWYRTLADDSASPGEWLQAAQSILRPSDVKVTPGSMFGTGFVTTPRRETGEKPPCKGESLRGRKDPGVTALLAKRADELSLRGSLLSSEARDRLHAACRLAFCLAEWDPKGALPMLRQLTERCCDILAQSAGDSRSEDPYLALCITRLVLHRAPAEDEKAFEDYAAWIREVTPSQVDHYAGDVFEPLWRYPDHPTLAKVAEWLFEGDFSPWNPIIDPARERQGFRVTRIFRTYILEVPAFRKQMVRMLGDKREAGQITVRSSGRVEVKIKGGWTTSESVRGEGPVPPAPGTVAPFRLCDLYARELSLRNKEIPRCKLYWPVDERDRAVAACADFIKSYKGGKVPAGDGQCEIGP